MGEFAKSLEGVTRFDERRHPQRINRRLDDRNNVIFEALKLLETRSSAIYPTAHVVPAELVAPSVGGGAQTDIDVIGVNFIGDATKSTGTSENSSGQLNLEAVLPGEQTITCTITDTGAALGVTADVDAGTIAVVVGDGNGAGTGGAYTVAEVLAEINGDAVAKYMVNATQGVAGDIDADESITVDGGTGDLMSLSIGAYPMSGIAAGNGITNVTDTTITLDFDPSDMDGAAAALVATTAYSIDLVVDGVRVPMPFLIVAV